MSWLIVVLAGACAFSACGAEIRFNDVLYLDEGQQPAMELKVLRRTPLAFTRDPSSVIAYLAAGQRVQLLGMGDKYHYVLAQIVTGPARGWIEADAIESPPEQMRADLQKRREKMLAHRALIERHEVGLGMTRDEVLASLGKPDRKAYSRTAQGDEDQWYYVTYKYFPQLSYFRDERGELRQSITYRRVPAGQRMIAFRNGEVVEVASDVEERRPPPDSLIIPNPPMVVY